MAQFGVQGLKGLGFGVWGLGFNLVFRQDHSRPPNPDDSPPFILCIPEAKLLEARLQAKRDELKASQPER